jgi:peptidoglycan/LPS O-acetylase OafA/YrhL
MLKRIARLDPPYLASVALVVLSLWVSSRLPGLHQPFQMPWADVAAHLGYVNAFVGLPWLQISYWSLAIEFQYYIFVGLCFPLLAWKRRWGPAVILLLFAAASLLEGKSEALLPHYLPLFAMGVLVFRQTCIETPRLDAIAGLLAAFALAVWVDGWLPAGVALAASLVIRFLYVDNRVLNFFGASAILSICFTSLSEMSCSAWQFAGRPGSLYFSGVCSS